MVNGTTGEDMVILTQLDPNTVNVNLNSTDLGNFTITTKLTIYTCTGNDTIIFTNPITSRIHLNGSDDYDIFDMSALNLQVNVWLGPESNIDPNVEAPVSFENIEHIITGQNDDHFIFVPGVDLQQPGILDGWFGTDTLDFSRLNYPIQANIHTGQTEGFSVWNMDNVIGPLFHSNDIHMCPSYSPNGLSALSGTLSTTKVSASSLLNETLTPTRRAFTNNGGANNTTQNGTSNSQAFDNTTESILPIVPSLAPNPPLDSSPSTLDSQPSTLNSDSTLDPAAIDAVMADWWLNHSQAEDSGNL